MPNALRSKAVALLLLWVLVAGVFVVATTASAGASGVSTATQTTLVSSLVSTEDGSAVTSPDWSSPDLMNKMSPELREDGLRPNKDGSVDVVIHTNDVPALSAALVRIGARRTGVIEGEMRDVAYVARPWGAQGQPTTLTARVPASALEALAELPSVLYIGKPRLAATGMTEDPLLEEEQANFQRMVDRIKAGEKPIPGMKTLGGADAGAAPTSWAIAREHKAYDAWQMGYTGAGVNVAVIDTGEDFGHPSLHQQWAVAPPGSEWAGWPIMFHPASMEALFAPSVFGTGWTADVDLARLPLPFWLSGNDGDSWYSNTDYVANDSDLDGDIVYVHGTPNPFTGVPQYTPRVNPQGYGASCGGANSARISRTYIIGAPGESFQIRSASGAYHLGLTKDDTLTGLLCARAGVLVVDSAASGAYDTVYVDLNFDLNFTNDKALTVADPIAVADIFDSVAGAPGQDGVPDISGGLLYFIGSSTPVTGETVLDPILGTETSASLAKWWDFDGDGTMESTSVAVDITGARPNFAPATTLWLRDPVSGLLYYTPGSTEVIYEEYTGTGTELGTVWDLGGPFTSFGPINIITGQSVPTGTLLRGPGPDFAVSVTVRNLGEPPTVIDFEDSIGPLTEDVDFLADWDSGSITWLRPFGVGETVYILYQLETYLLEPVSGTILFEDATTGTPSTFPAGWSLLADYETGLPIPYSQVYGPAHGYDTFIPADGDLVAFHGDFDNGQSHGSFVSSTVAARPFGNLVFSGFEVFGTAPSAKIIGIAACCNVPGPLGFFGSIEDQRTFAAVGYDGVPGTGDEAVIISNSFGDPGSLEMGFTWEDRWLIDFRNRWRNSTLLIALGNNGPGYGTAAPGGSSPGVIGVGAGTSGDYRILAGNDGGEGYWELPLCPPGPYPDPALCVGFGGIGGPGPYGDHIFFSSRGPTLLGSPKPDIVSIGGYGWEAGPLNVFGAVPADLDGNYAIGVFSGTSQATPVTAGVTALIAQAFMDAHGRFPTNVELRELLKSTADDMHRDVLQQGAGWTNALRGVQAALDDPGFIGMGGGVTSSLDYWIPGDYQGTRRVGFVNFLNPGASDSTRITLTNRNPGVSESVTVSDAVYQMAARFSHPFSLGTGINQFVVLKDDGVYDFRGAVKISPTIDFRPYWNTADFVKVTFAYDAIAFTGGTNFRLDTFDWYDSNANGQFDQDFAAPGVPSIGWGERVRMTVAANGAGANSVWETTYHPGLRIHDGWALNPRSGAANPIPATLIVEFYEKADWPWIDWILSDTLIGALQTETLDVTATLPLGTPGGLYEGAIYITDSSGDTTTVPIVINVPVTGFPVLMGGNVPTTSLYDNSGVIQGARSSGWRQIGDVRTVWADVTIAPGVGRKVIYNAIMQGPKSDIEMFVYSLSADAAWPDDALYGPGTMSLHCNEFDKTTSTCTKTLKTKEIVGTTDSLYAQREFMHSDPNPVDILTRRVTPIGGLIAFQIKGWSSREEMEPLSANIGIMEVTPVTYTFSSNKLAGTVPSAIWANVPLLDGVGAAVTESFLDTTTINNIAGNNDFFPGGSFDAWMCRQIPPNQIVLPAIGPVISRSVNVHITSPNSGDDHDLQVWLDANNNGVCDAAADVQLCQQADGDADEQCEGATTDGTKRIFIQVGQYGPSAGIFHITYIETTLIIGVSPFALVGPTTDVAPNTAIAGGISWNLPGNSPPGTTTGKLFVSPGYAKFGLAIGTDIRYTYDITPPTINRATHLSPAPDSIINAPLASVVANMLDTRGELDRFSVQLQVDGVDVTGTAKLTAPYSNGYGILPVTIAWEHTVPFVDGPHTAVVNVKDRAGNLRTEVWTWTVDTTGPSLAVTSPGSDILTNGVSVPLVAQTDVGSTVTVTMNGVPQTFSVDPDGVVTATLATPDDGTYVVVVESADALGNGATLTRTITRDGTSPVVTAGVDVRRVTNLRSTRIAGTVDESVASICVSRAGTALGCTTVGADGSFSIVVPLEEGSNVFDLETTDAAGNTGTVSLAAIERDTVAPTITLDSLPVLIDDVAEDTVIVSGTVSTSGLFFVTVNGHPASLDRTTGRFSAEFPLAVGENTFIVQAQDDADNVAEAVASVAYSPVLRRDVPNYNSIIASGVAVVLLIVGFVVGYLLSGRGGAAEEPSAEPPAETPAPKAESRAEEELPSEERKAEEEEL